MKKSAFLFAGTCAVSALLATALSVYFVDRRIDSASDAEYVERTVERPVVSHTPALGSQFTAYSADSYPDLTYAAENAVKAVVNVEVTQEIDVISERRGFDPFFEFFGIPRGYSDDGGVQRRERRVGGSGVIISEDGYIVTNNHVTENASKLRVKLYDGRTFDAKIIGSDSEWVLAIGSPFDLQSTVTAGIVSAKARNLDVIPNEFRIESFIQTDAAVNMGNSGGALVNTRGELVGINTVIKSSTGSYIGYSFAIPETIVRKVVCDLREYGIVQRALLGISYRYIDQDFIDAMGERTGIDTIGGVYVASVSEGGAADEAGIRKGDVITEIDGVAITSSATLYEQIGRHRPNDKVKISVKRGDSVKHFDVTLRNKAGKAELLTPEDVDVMEVLGGRFADASPKVLKRLGLRGGVQVTDVKNGGLLARARVRDGFIITGINDRPVRSVSELNAMTDKVVSIEGIYPDGRQMSFVVVE